MKIHLSKIETVVAKIKPPKTALSNVLIIAALAVFVGFGATFGARWGLLAAVPGLVLLGVAVGN